MIRTLYGQAATALIAEQDIAAVATRVLLDPGHAGQTYYLTGQQSLTQIQKAEAIGSVIGRQVRFEELSPEAFRRAGQIPGVSCPLRTTGEQRPCHAGYL